MSISREVVATSRLGPVAVRARRPTLLDPHARVHRRARRARDRTPRVHAQDGLVDGAVHEVQPPALIPPPSSPDQAHKRHIAQARARQWRGVRTESCGSESDADAERIVPRDCSTLSFSSRL